MTTLYLIALLRNCFLSLDTCRTRGTFSRFARCVLPEGIHDEIALDTILSLLVFKLLLLCKLLIIALLRCGLLRCGLCCLRLLLPALLHCIGHWLDDVVLILPLRRLHPHTQDFLEVDVLFVDIS